VLSVAIIQAVSFTKQKEAGYKVHYNKKKLVILKMAHIQP
jgi:hypothetical protein